jgi:hypothetical protein
VKLGGSNALDCNSGIMSRQDDFKRRSPMGSGPGSRNPLGKSTISAFPMSCLAAVVARNADSAERELGPNCLCNAAFGAHMLRARDFHAIAAGIFRPIQGLVRGLEHLFNMAGARVGFRNSNADGDRELAGH